MILKKENLTASTNAVTEPEYFWDKEHNIPPMNEKRKHVTAVCDDKYLIAAGGREKQGPTKTVEVLDLTKNIWMYCADLPRAVFRASGCVNEFYLYIFGGHGFDRKRLSSLVRKDAYKISLSELLDSHKERKSEVKAKGKFKKIKSVPLLRSACTTFCHKIYAVGGSDLENDQAEEVESSNLIYEYDPKKDSWKLVNCLREPRCYCFAVSICDKYSRP